MGYTFYTEYPLDSFRPITPGLVFWVTALSVGRPSEVGTAQRTEICDTVNIVPAISRAIATMYMSLRTMYAVSYGFHQFNANLRGV